MLEHVDVKSFQSIHSMSLDLGRFTVILGDSNVGKTAFIRSLHALVNNVQGNSHVTHEHKFAAVTATLTDWIVTIERGEGRSLYRVTNRLTGEELVPFGKLNKGVPERIVQILDMNGTNIAGQFDAPYLLTDPGSQVARVLGELTNVNTIYEAVQLGNKQRDRLSGELRTRQADLDKAMEELQTFQDLPNQITYVSSLENLMSDADELQNRVTTITAGVMDLQDAQTILDDSREYPEVPELDDIEDLAERRRTLVPLIEDYDEGQTILGSFREYPEVPDLQEILDLQDRRTALAELFEGLTDVLGDLTQAKMDWNEADTLEKYYETSLHDLLVRAGTCPTCNQSVK